MPKLIGHCYCQGIHFEVTPPTRMFSHCHCESCRRSHGAAFVSWTSVPNEQFEITKGTALISEYESSPGILWKFCRKCGSSLFQTTSRTPEITYVVVAALNGIDRPAEGHMSFEEKVPWLEVHDSIPKFKQKTSDLVSKVKRRNTNKCRLEND